MKTSCNSWSYHRAFAAGKMDLFSWIEECARLDLDGVELLGCHFPDKEPATLKRIKRQCAEKHLTIAMTSADGRLTTPDDAQRDAEVRAIGEWMDAAFFLGAPLVRFFCGGGGELAAGGPALYAKVVEAMKRIAAMGEERGIVAALENHGGTSADQLLSLREAVGSPWLAFALDTGNFPPTSRVGPETYRGIERCAPHAAIVHAKFFDVTPGGRDAAFDWPHIHSTLRGAGFRGFLSVEYEGQDPDEIGCMRRIAGFLKTLR